MRKYVFYLCVLLYTIIVNAQKPAVISSSTTSNNSQVIVDSILMEISHDVDRIAYQLRYMDENRGRYKIYKTDNIYNMLKLDTATGWIEQVQWSLDSNKEFSIALNPQILSYKGKIGTFELFPTNNIYQFILLDTTDGRVWHVQWGTESEKRWIRRIY